jgi:Concanavalin A-like lectin/glucanases superfamily
MGCALAASGCNGIFGIGDLSYDGGVGGGATGGASSSSASDGGAGGAIAVGGAGGLGGFGGAGGAGGALPMLSDRGLVARYWIDEAATGMPGFFDKLLDSATDPFDLPIFAAFALAWVEATTGRGLQWQAAGSFGMANESIGTSKLAALEGSTTVTVEAVLTLDGLPPYYARILQISPPENVAARLGLRITTGGLLSMDINDNGGGVDHSGLWNPPLPVNDRIVLHAVMDTSGSAGQDRLRAYVDGVALTSISNFPEPVVPPAMEEALNFGPSPYFAIGNRAQGDRGFVGTIHYLALYDSAFTPARVGAAASALAVSDDP